MRMRSKIDICNRSMFLNKGHFFPETHCVWPGESITLLVYQKSRILGELYKRRWCCCRDACVSDSKLVLLFLYYISSNKISENLPQLVTIISYTTS